MKKVVTRSMVAHLWANQSQPEARTQNGSFFFNGRSIFSYGTHYCAAHITPWVHDGKTVVLVNSHRYSNTSQRHLTEISYALRGHTDKVVFYVDSMSRATVHSESLCVNIIEKCGSEIRVNLDKLSGFRAEWKIRNALDTARKAYELAKIAYANSTGATAKKEFNDVKKLAVLIPDETDKKAIKALIESLSKRDEITNKEKNESYVLTGIRNIEAAFHRLGESHPLLEGIEPLDSIYLPEWRDVYNKLNDLLLRRKQIDVIAKRYKLKKAKNLPTLKTLEALRAFADDKAGQEWLASAVSLCRNAIRAIKRGHDVYHITGGFIDSAYEKANANEKHIIDLARKLYARKIRGNQVRQIPARLHELEEALLFAQSRESSQPETALHYYKRNLSEFARMEAITSPLTERAKQHFLKGAPFELLENARNFVATYEQRKLELSKEQIARWREGNGTMTSVRFLVDFPICRYNAKTERLETSYGAEMPKAHARAVWLAIQKAKRQGADYVPTPDNAEKMGAFRLTRARVDGSIVAGCHDIPSSEIEYIAGVLGYLNDNVTTISSGA